MPKSGNLSGRVLVSVVALAVVAWQGSAVEVEAFSDINRYIGDGRTDIVIARRDSQSGSQDGEFNFCTVHVLRVISGTRAPGQLKVATLAPLTVGTRYMLWSRRGGRVADVDFLVTGQLSVVPLPDSFDLSSLDGLSVKDEVTEVFSQHAYEIERRLDPLLQEKALLEKGLAGRIDLSYQSPVPLKLTAIQDVVTSKGGSDLQLDGHALWWSASSLGKNGYLYFESPKDRKPAWEFATTSLTSLEQYETTPVQTTFYGRYTPGRPEAWRGVTSIIVNVGDVLLARRVADRSKAYILQIASQSQDEVLHIRYAAIPK